MNNNTVRILNDLQRVFVQYNPEHDVPDGPQVTWADHRIAGVLGHAIKIISAMQDQILEMAKILDQDRTRIENLEKVNDQALAPDQDQHPARQDLPGIAGKLAVRLRECESLLLAMIRQYTFQWPDPGVYQHDHLACTKDAFEYLVKYQMATWTDEKKHSILMESLEK